MAMATTMWHTKRNPLRKVSKDSEQVDAVREAKRRTLHKAFLRYHDPENWALLREALLKMGRRDLIGMAPHHLVPPLQAIERKPKASPQAKPGAACRAGLQPASRAAFKPGGKSAPRGAAGAGKRGKP